MLYLTEDVQRGILATCQAVLTTAQASGTTNVEFVRGALAFARAQATLYGLAWPAMVCQLKEEHHAGLVGDLGVIMASIDYRKS